jgi:hypothetical protein
MRRTVYVLLAIEALLLIAALVPHISHLLADMGSPAVLLLAVNSVLLIWAVSRLWATSRRKPSCCR